LAASWSFELLKLIAVTAHPEGEWWTTAASVTNPSWLRAQAALQRLA
jgi:hypothetical protein